MGAPGARRGLSAERDAPGDLRQPAPHSPGTARWLTPAFYVRYEGREDKETDETKGHKFLVFAVNCAHLGCPVAWFPQSGLFMCPCHGGVYYANGERASGPAAARPLSTALLA